MSLVALIEVNQKVSGFSNVVDVVKCEVTVPMPSQRQGVKEYSSPRSLDTVATTRVATKKLGKYLNEDLYNTPICEESFLCRYYIGCAATFTGVVHVP